MKKAIVTVAAAIAVLLATRLLGPDPIAVETAPVTRGPMSVFVEEEGVTRARDRFVVAAPIAGRMERIRLREGDRVQAGQTLTRISPQPLDPRARAEAVSRVAAAEAVVRESEDRAQAERARFESARRDRERAESLHRSGDIALDRVEHARTAETTAERAWEGARHRLEAARQDVVTARAALASADPQSPIATGSVAVRAPVSGLLLQIIEESERIVPAGAPIAAIGDAGRLEIVIDVLSSDAVRLRPGAPVWIEEWGGDRTLRAVVRIVEPHAFKKVSALGVDERRVPVVADFVDPPGALGDGYRVEARIEVWRGDDVLKLPADAAFRTGDRWTVFVAQGNDGKTAARLREVKIGQRNPNDIEIIEGLREGEAVIVRPPRELEEGARVRTRG